MEDTILQNKDTVKKTSSQNLRRECGVIKELEEKRKLRYYKDVINPNLEEKNCLSVL
jgi:hypothetical protein